MIVLRYGLDGNTALTLSEIGERLGITRERVRQIEKEALTRLNSLPEAQCLRSEPWLSPPTATCRITKRDETEIRDACELDDVGDSSREEWEWFASCAYACKKAKGSTRGLALLA